MSLRTLLFFFKQQTNKQTKKKIIDIDNKGGGFGDLSKLQLQIAAHPKSSLMSSGSSHPSWKTNSSPPESDLDVGHIPSGFGTSQFENHLVVENTTKS